MKKILLLACTIISFATITQAQIKKGSVLLGGSFGFSKNEYEADANEGKTKSFLAYPSAGVAIKDNWIIGLSGGLSGTRYKPEVSGNTYKSNGFSSGLFVRRYMSLSKSFYLYGNAGISYNKSESEERHISDYTRNIAVQGVSFSVTPGITYAVNNHFHLEAALNNLLNLSYNKNIEERVSSGDKYKTESKTFDYGTNFSNAAPLTIGFRFVLGK
ncbi:MAG TPA: outer membrane beta-barrel protein [Flavisolibacter sp.]|nr:outer membrane beta-barrel protein [Flavisolibacter sp.]